MEGEASVLTSSFYREEPETVIQDMKNGIGYIRVEQIFKNGDFNKQWLSLFNTCMASSVFQ